MACMRRENENECGWLASIIDDDATGSWLNGTRPVPHPCYRVEAIVVIIDEREE